MMRAENFQSLEINFGKLLLLYFMRPQDVEALVVMRPLVAWDPVAICPLPSPLGSGPASHSCTFTGTVFNFKVNCFCSCIVFYLLVVGL